MGNYLEEYRKELQQISRGKIERMVDSIVLLNTGNIVVNVRERWQKGQSVNGGIIGTYRWEDYRLFKQSLNPLAGGTVDLFLTGALAEGLTIKKVSSGVYQVYSTDSKYNQIGDKYGFEEFGVNPDEFKSLMDEVYGFAFESLFNELWR